MAFYTDENGNVVSSNAKVEKQKTKKVRSTTFSLAKVFGYMFIGLLITSVVAFIAGAIFGHWLSVDPNTAAEVMIWVLMGSAIATIILSFVIAFSLKRKSVYAMLIPMLLYVVLFGILLSSFTIYLDWWLLASAFGITCLIFGLMTLISVFAKNMKGALVVGIGLIIGASLISVFNLIMMLAFPQAFQSIYWLVSLGFFAGMMFITMFDIWRIKQICAQGEMSENLALYCAFVLYADFIYILIRILSLFANSKN